MQIARCPVCGAPGSLIRIPVVIRGKRYGPYPAVQHYAGYDRQRRRRKVKVCYIRIQRLDPNQKAQLERLIQKHSNE